MTNTLSPEAQAELEAYWAGSITAQLPQKMWDAESRNSPYCTVWSPEQDDEEGWQVLYDEARAAGHDDLTATEMADAGVLA